MKKCRWPLSRFPLFFVFLLFLVVSPLARAQDDGTADGLRIKIECEEPSGIFLDSETTAIQRAILFSIHVFNQSNEARTATLNWRVRDASGKVVQAGEQKYPIPAGGFITRRELLTTPKLGAFLLQADAFSRRDGPDLKAELVFPFAVITAPKSEDARPFLLLDAPLELGERELVALSRLGARALRTEIAPTADNENDAAFWKSLNASLRARLERGLGTVGVLRAPRGEGPRGARDDEEWLQWALRVMVQTPAIVTWEITGQAAPETISELSRAARNMNPSRGVLATPRGTSGDLKKLQPAAGLLYQLSAEDASVHPAALRRALIGAQSRSRESGLQSFHVRNVGALNTPDLTKSEQTSALESAQLMTSQTVASLAAGAQGASTRMFADDRIGHETLARGAAFAALNSLLGDADFHSDLFPTSPVVMGAIFGRESSAGSVAVLWTALGMDGKESRGRLEAWLPDARVLDLFGNPLAGAERKNLSIPLSAQPVFVTSDANPEELARHLREGFVSGIAPLAAQVLPLDQPLEYAGEMKPKDNKFAPANKLPIRVRLHNIGTGDLSGTLRINPPPSWKLDVASQQFDLKMGESRIYDFGVSLVKPNDEYPVKVDASAVLKSGGKTVKDNWSWTQNAIMATATNVVSGENLSVDGRLDDWQKASWMELADKNVKAHLAVKWDASRLYFAARVREPQLQPRNPNTEYAFWRGTDAIQIGFGLRDAAWMQPGSTPFRDTDFGFLLSPFHTRPDGTIEARVLRLWSPQIPLGPLPDRMRWGGAVNGAQIEIRRDERSGETIYEAAIPLGEIPDLNPAGRIATKSEFGSPVRFSWILHNNEGDKLEWAHENNVLDWWNNTHSFLPANDFSYAAQTLLGFSHKGEVAAGTQSTPAPILPPAPAVAPAQTPVPVLPPAPVEEDLPPYLPNVENPPPPAPPRSTPAPPKAAPRPVPVEPISPDMLPPAPPPT